MQISDTVIASDRIKKAVLPSDIINDNSPEGLNAVRTLLEQVTDPEIPVLTIGDLGLLRDISWQDDNLVIVITPTYSGCPAMKTFEDDILSLLRDQGIDRVIVKTQLSPAWTTDWLSEEGKQKLEDYGIAPPASGSTSKRSLLGEDPVVRCPQCKSENTKVVSFFGSTACKALYQCNDCLEPFDYFKCI